MSRLLSLFVMRQRITRVPTKEPQRTDDAIPFDLEVGLAIKVAVLLHLTTYECLLFGRRR